MPRRSGKDADVLKIGRELLAQLDRLSEPELASFLTKVVADPEEQGSVAAALFTAIVDGRAHRTHGTGTHGSAAAVVGVAAGLSGHSGDLYRAARLSRDAQAVERSLETGDPKYIERRVKNKLVGRAMGRAGVWRKLWR